MNKLRNRFLNRSPHVMSIYLPTHPPIYLPIYLSINSSIYLRTSIHPFIHLSKSMLHSGSAPYDPVQRILSSYLLSKNVKINIFNIQNTFQHSITSMAHAVKIV